MSLSIFYSWQSDTPSALNRNFIEDALERAIKALGKKIEIQKALRDSELQLDKDTKGVPGTPPIVETIFNKIDNCTIFVPDLTFVGKSSQGRMLPNPNVLIEYGWALKSISYSRIIPVMNAAFGEPTSDNMPFDMRHLPNPITYKIQADSKEDDRKSEKNKLIKTLADAIEAIIHSGVVEELLSEPHAVEEFSFDNPSRFCSEIESLATITDVHGTDNKLFLLDSESLFLRIIPTKQVDAFKLEKESCDTLTSGQLVAMGPNRDDITYRLTERNKHGAIICKYKDSKIINLTQLFLSKQIWGIDLDSINKANLMKYANVDFGFFPSLLIESVFNATLDNYLKFAANTLGLSTPLKFRIKCIMSTGFESF